MPQFRMSHAVADLRMELDDADHDPQDLHDRVQMVIDDMARRGEPVPIDLRQAVAELEAEILEAFHDNLPV